MRKIFTQPTEPEELYVFFTYGLPLTPLDWALRWQANGIHNTIRRKVWYAGVINHLGYTIIDYQSGTKTDSNSWYMYESKYGD